MPRVGSDRQKNNLPIDATSLVGRRAEAAEVRRLLSSSRLVTLTGVAGVGKTRLGLQVSRMLVRSFADGVWLVELAELTDPQLLELAVMRTLGLQSLEPERDAADALVEYLQPKQLLLVLDNCEHLVDACAILVARVLRKCREVRVLATSRHVLSIAGEQQFPVRALSLPTEAEEVAASEAKRSEAIELFAERASAVAPGFAVTADNQATVASVCRYLDGLPLAIELAAVWIRALSVQEVLRRIQDHDGLLMLDGRSGSSRYRTLRHAVDSSFQLCSQQERIVWARLSVFLGGADLEAVEEVCAGGSIARDDVLESLMGLVDKSILVREEVEGRTRFRLLETIRQYGQQRLRERGEQAWLRRKHRDYFRHLAGWFEQSWFGPNQVELFARMRAEHANLQAALECCLTGPGSAHLGLRLARSLWLYWIACGLQREGRHWLDRALTGNAEPSTERADALWADGHLTVLVGDASAALPMLEESRELAGRLGLPATLAHASYLLGLAELAENTSVRGMTLLEEGVTLERALGDRTPHLPLSLIHLGWAACLAQDAERGARLLRESHGFCESNGERWMLSWNLVLLGLARWQCGDTHTAVTSLREGLRYKRALHDPLSYALTVEFLAWCAVTMGEAQRAARLFGAGPKLWEPLGAFLIGFDVLLRWHNEYQQQARDMLGEQRFDAATDWGRRLTVDQAVAYALGETTAGHPNAVSTPDETLDLTRRESQVAKLVSQGMTNKDIAKALLIGPRTAESHVDHIMTKLGFTSRTQIATWFLAQQAMPE